MSLASLNSSGIQSSNPALYQTIKDLYDQNFILTNLLNSFGFTFNSDTKELTEANALILNKYLTVSGLLNLLNGQIQFPATQNPSTDVNVLDDYEEGTWTPTDNSGAGLVINTVVATYIKIGQLVYIDAQIVYPATASGAAASLVGLPFTSLARSALSVGLQGGGPANLQLSILSSKIINFNIAVTGANPTNTQMSGINFFFSGTYRATA